jgi:prepilin-type N-terminal cleavage/methylation domain-containing protein
MLRWFGRRLNDAQNEEKGFTLMELLIVIIILGILAGIAIPTYIAQKAKAQDAAALSDARNAGAAEVLYFADNNAFTNVLANLTAEGFRQSTGVSTTLINVPGNGGDGGYCVEMLSGSGASFHMAEAGGGAQPGTCT